MPTQKKKMSMNKLNVVKNVFFAGIGLHFSKRNIIWSEKVLDVDGQQKYMMVWILTDLKTYLILRINNFGKI